MKSARRLCVLGAKFLSGVCHMCVCVSLSVSF